MNATALERDAAARRRAQTEFERPVVLEAGAGTGKTTALVARLLAWTVGAGWDLAREELVDEPAVSGLRRAAPETDDDVAGAVLERVVAITFTDAAAAEMADRYQRELAALAAEAAAPDDAAWPPSWLAPEAFPSERPERARRARALLAAVDRLRVQTIHSFAFGLLRTHALELGLHPALAVDADETILRQVLHETLTELLPPRYRAADPALTLLASRGIGPREIAVAVTDLVGFGVEATELERDPFPPEALEAVLAPLAASAAALLACFDGVELSRRLTATTTLRAELAVLVELLARPVADRGELAQLCNQLDDALSKSARTKLANWRRASFAQAEEAGFEDCNAISAAAGSLLGDLSLVLSLDVELLDAARAVLAPVAAELERRMRARGRVTFSDLLRLAVRLLDKERVAASLRRGIRQLLVDEFQDTDELQAVIVRRLALEGPQEERPGLFLVGDPKQSIYGWRRARLSVYRDFVAAALGSGRGEPLTANFRSTAGVLAEVERVIAPIMSEQGETTARFEPLLARGSRRDEPAAIEYWLAWPTARERDAGRKRLGAAESARREAAAVAADLAQRIGDGVLRPRQAAILLRGKTHLESYLEALRERGVAFAVEKDRSYFRRRETVDAAALVRAALDPADLVALATLLRAPFVGVPDAALVPLWRAGLPERLAHATRADAETLAALEAIVDRAAAAVAALPEPVSGLERVPSWPDSLRAALGALVERRDAFDTEDPLLWVDRLRLAFDPDLAAAARWQGAHRLANLDRLFRDLGERLQAGEAPYRILADLRRTVAERADAPEGRPLESADDAVRVMTLHTAKGLEFEEVYLVGLHQGTGAHRSAPAQAAEKLGDRWEYRLFGAPTPGFAPVRDLDERIRGAEQVRLLYVGMTRAVRRLVLVGALPTDGAPAAPERAATLAELVGGRLPAGPEWRDDLRAADAAGLRDDQGARWRILPEPEPVAPGASAAPERQETDRLDPEAALARRAREREAALRRQGRARIATITEVAELEAAATEDEEPAASPRFPEAQDAARQEALARGTALHLALELAPLATADPERWRGAARAAFERALPTGDEAARARFDARLERLGASRLLERLEELRPRIVARELPLLLVEPTSREEGPIDGATGAIDLLYRDPGNDAPVVADFKSDAVDDDGVADLVARYTAQLELYGDAVRDALGLDAPPRKELWLLELDRIVALD